MDSMLDDSLIISIVIFSSIKVLSIVHQQTQQAQLCAIGYGLFFAITKVVIPIMLGITLSDHAAISFVITWMISGFVVFCGLALVERARSDAVETILYIVLGAALVLLIFVV